MRVVRGGPDTATKDADDPEDKIDAEAGKLLLGELATLAFTRLTQGR